jgi:hypothetical protein
LSLDVAGVLLLVGIVVPGLMCVHIGLRTWRKDWLAMETYHMVSPLFFSMAYYFLVDPLLRRHFATFLPYLIALLISAVLFFYLGSFGDILVLRARGDVVLRGVQGILDRLHLGYTLDGDRFDLPEIGFWIEINGTMTGNYVGVRTPWRRVPVWTKTVHEEVLNLFVGRPSEKPHPALLMTGLVLLAVALVVGTVLATG